jgi:hypothetical protein
MDKEYTLTHKIQPYVRYNIYTTDGQNLLLHVSAIYECHYQGVITLLKVVLALDMVCCNQHSHIHKDVQNFFIRTQEIPSIKCKNVKTVVEILLQALCGL